MALMQIQEDYMEQGIKQMKQSMHILMLNEYCLLDIFEYLEIDEVFRMEEVCTRFQEISQRIYRTIRKLDIDTLYEADLSVSDVTQIIRRVGPYIHTLSVDGCSITSKKGEIPQFVSYDIDRPDLKVEPVKDETFAFRSLKNVDLENCDVNDINFSFLPFEQLEKLSLERTKIFRKKTYNFFKRLRNIIEINLNEIELDPFDTEWFKKCCETNPNLRSLDLCYTEGVYPDDLHVIASTLKNLETLSLSKYYDEASQEDFCDIAELPKLKNLRLYESDNPNAYYEDTTQIDLRQFLLLVSRHNRLETLQYELVELEVEFSTITRALSNLTNLKEFTIRFSNENLQFFDDVLESFTDKHKLEQLIIQNMLQVTSQAIEMFIKRCPRIRLIDMTYQCQYKYQLEIDLLEFLNNIRDCLSQRSHVLEIEIRMPKDQQKKCEDLLNGNDIKNLKLVFK